MDSDQGDQVDQGYGTQDSIISPSNNTINDSVGNDTRAVPEAKSQSYDNQHSIISPSNNTINDSVANDTRTVPEAKSQGYDNQQSVISSSNNTINFTIGNNTRSHKVVYEITFEEKEEIMKFEKIFKVKLYLQLVNKLCSLCVYCVCR